LAPIAAASEDASKPPTLIPSEIPEFEANYVKNRAGYSRYTGFPEYQLFALFFTEKIVQTLVANTNSYAEFHRANDSPPILHSRQWVPTNTTEMRVYLNINLYFGLYQMAVREDYWRIHKLGKYMGLKRFEQLHRYFTVNDEDTHSRPPGAPWYNKLQPIADDLRAACKDSYSLFSHISIDEAMVFCEGRIKHTVKLKNKPIDTGYKIWAIGDHGYI
jgi:Transposase IS4